MSRNTGKLSEAIFNAHWASYGKRAFCRRVTDSAEIQGRNPHIKQRITVPKQPSDYLVTVNGTMFYAEVKSTQKGTGFKKSMLTDVQLGSCRQQVAAEGQYIVFFHHLAKDDWYAIPGALILEYPEGTIPWAHLQPYKWTPNARLHG